MRLGELMQAIRERHGQKNRDVCFDCARRAHSQELKECRS
jgi:hypothetical protein